MLATLPSQPDSFNNHVHATTELDPGTSRSQAIQENLTVFLESTEYTLGSEPVTLDKSVEDTILADIFSRSIPVDKKKAIEIARLSAVIAHRAYRLHHWDIQVQIAMFTFLAIWVDDNVDDERKAVEEFQHRFLSGQPQLHPMLDRFVECLMDMKKFWDPLCADMIVSSTFYFMHGNLLESRRDISGMKLHGPSTLWPTWVRSMTGVASAYALFIFPASVCSDICKFLQTIPELDSWTRSVNDILSFYKEDMQGETSTYVHFRAECAGREDTLDVLSELVSETSDSYRWAREIFSADPTLFKYFRTYVSGYIQFHTVCRRYRLSELGMGELLEFQ